MNNRLYADASVEKNLGGVNAALQLYVNIFGAQTPLCLKWNNEVSVSLSVQCELLKIPGMKLPEDQHIKEPISATNTCQQRKDIHGLKNLWKIQNSCWENYWPLTA